MKINQALSRPIAISVVAAGMLATFSFMHGALGGTAAISAGVAFAHRLPERRLRLGFCGLLLITAMLLAARG